MLHADDDPRNADWTKTIVWDLPTDADRFIRAVLGEEEDRQRLAWLHFKTLPTYEAMPDDLREAVERRLGS